MPWHRTGTTMSSWRLKTYLAKVKRELESEGLDVGTVVREGQPAAEILAEASASRSDLIILTAFGLGGAHVLRPNAVFGSVADSVLRESRAPVLVVRP
jgi:nucleotide-binding universal stress UspA family protein